MRVSLKWLKDYVEIKVPLEELKEKLTMAGLEVAEEERIGAEWENIFVGEVVGLDKHPNADRLWLATVNLGEEQCRVICGAPNVRVGIKVPFARVGAKLFDGHTGQPFKLKPAKIRGILSEGMLCSEKELGISERHEGIMVLPEEAPTGLPLAQFLGDVILDIKVTTNRPDCLSMLGIAREVAALTGGKVKLPEVRYEEQEPSAEQMVAVEIADPELCPRYCAGIVTGVKVGESPPWLQERLLAAGMRPINNVVDITNYVMLEYGQPLHAFDYQKIGGKKIIVRRAEIGEGLLTLDGKERWLSNEMLVIADADKPVALAGIMGGAESEVTAETTSILLEAANFNPASIHRTSFRLGLKSEASSRFEKGISPDLTVPALRRAIGLVVELAGGKVARGIVDAYPGIKPRDPILLSMGRIKQVLGIGVSISKAKEVLQSLGFECEQKSSSELLVTIPYWRTDICVADDLVEEVARIIGYDEIPTIMLSGEIPRHEPAPLLSLRERLRDILAGCGMQEIITYSLTSREMLNKIKYQNQFGPPIRVANPLSREQEYLRISLRGGLLATFAANERHSVKGIRLFEIGKIYLPREGTLPEEREMLGGILGGPKFERTWFGEKGELDFFSAKGILETLFAHLAIKVSFEPGEDPLLIPGRTAKIMVEGEQVGVVGELHPDVAASFELSTQPVSLFELEVEKLLPFVEQPRTYQPIPKFPGVVRDIALLVDADLPAKRVQDIIQAFPQVNQATIFDVYQGEQIPPGKKSLAFSIRYQSPERTLTDEEVDRLQENILRKLEQELGAVLRR